jgi:hypothetical protein
MKTKRYSLIEWDFSLWFVALSPVLGVLLGLFGVFLVQH